MPRRPRYQLTDFPLHVVQRGNDRRACFFEERDFRFYLQLLGEAVVRHHVLAACRYIDLNPVRAQMVEHPRDYRWSSYRALAGIRVDVLVTPHAALEQLGTSPIAYARWCEAGSDHSEIERLRHATEHELAFGSDAFKEKIESMSDRATVARPPGPPRGFRKGT